MQATVTTAVLFVLALAMLPCMVHLQAQELPLPSSPAAIPRPSAQAWTPPRVERLELVKGARALVLSDSELPLVEGRLLLRSGSWRESAAEVGLLGVLADALREGGSERYPGPELSRWLDEHAALLEPSYDGESFGLRFVCASADLPAVLERAADLLAAPVYPDKVVELARQRALSAIERRSDSAAGMAERALARVCYGATSVFGRESSSATVGALTREALLRFHRANFGADRLLLGLAGDLSSASLPGLLNPLLERLPSVGPAAALPNALFLTPMNSIVYVVDRPGVPQTELRIASPGTRFDDPRAPALQLWSYLVGTGGMSNRMLSSVRTEQGLAYSVGARFAADWSVPGRLQAWCATKNEQCGRALEAMIEILVQSGTELAQTEELEAARERLTNTEVLRYDTPEKILARALDLEFHGYPADHFEQLSKAVAKLGPQDVLKAARDTIRPLNLVCVAVGPAEQITASLSQVMQTVLLPAEATLSSSPDALAQVQRMLAAVGGKQAWAAIKGLELESELRFAPTAEVPEPAPVPQHWWRSLEEQCLRLEWRSGSQHMIQVFGQGQAWRQTPLARQDMNGDQLALLLRQDARWIYRLIHQSAAGALERGELAVTLESPTRLQFADAQGELCWMDLAQDGKPVAVGYTESGKSNSYLYADWTEVDGISYAKRLRQEQAGVLSDVLITRFVPNPILDPALFTRP